MTEVEKKAAEILGRVKLGTIGVTQRNGTPHVFTAYIAADKRLNVYFISVKGSGHRAHLGEERSAAMAVYDSRQEWDDWKDGIQMWGRLRLATGQEEEEGQRCYETKFPEYKKWLEGEGKGSDKAEVYRYEWDRIRVLAEAEWGEEEFRETARRSEGKQTSGGSEMGGGDRGVGAEEGR